jgi:hypothetical protein
MQAVTPVVARAAAFDAATTVSAVEHASRAGTRDAFAAAARTHEIATGTSAQTAVARTVAVAVGAGFDARAAHFVVGAPVLVGATATPPYAAIAIPFKARAACPMGANAATVIIAPAPPRAAVSRSNGRDDPCRYATGACPAPTSRTAADATTLIGAPTVARGTSARLAHAATKTIVVVVASTTGGATNASALRVAVVRPRGAFAVIARAPTALPRDVTKVIARAAALDATSLIAAPHVAGGAGLRLCQFLEAYQRHRHGRQAQ